MRSTARCLALAVALAVFLPVAFASTASAQMLREFEGEIQKVSGSQVVVDNKKGDKIQFKKADETTVEGEKKTWDDLSKGDWVSVHSKMLEKPRKAYKVVVMPPKPDED